MWPRHQRPNRRVPAAPAASPEPERTGIEFAWCAHEAIQGWTASVDAKTSIVLVVETAVSAAAATALITSGGVFHQATGLHLATAITAAVLLTASVAMALYVVFPRLERSRTRHLAARGLIYFGHLRERSADDIAAALAQLTPEQERGQLASQLRITGDLAWRKHSWLQRSLVCLFVGAALLVVAYTAF